MSPEAEQRLAEREIPLRREPILQLHHSGGQLAEIEFEGGRRLARDGLFFATGCRQSSDLSKRLGCKRDDKGGVVTDADTEETSVAGVCVAGDVSRDVLMVSVAIAEGAKAAVAINKSFLRRDGFCEP